MIQARLAKYYLFSACLLMGLFVGDLRAQPEVNTELDWKVISSHKNITVYEATGKHAGTVPIRFHTVLDYPASRVRTILADTIRRPEWTPNMVEARILEKRGSSGKIEYLRYKFPWPFKSREFVLLNETIYDPNDKTLTSTTASTTHTDAPDSDKYIRALTLAGKVITRPTGVDNKTYMEAMFHTDMMGSIPGWLFRLIQRSWPKKVVKNLNQQLARDDIRVEDRWLLLDK
jgi:hypothetical protein